MTYEWDAAKKQFPVPPLPDFVARVQKIATPDDTLLVMCRSGGRGAMAVNLLAEAGFKDVYNIIDGMEGDVVQDPDSIFEGQRLKNGWKNSGCPWTYEPHWGPTAALGNAAEFAGAGAQDDRDSRTNRLTRSQSSLQQLSDFSLVAGGPLYQFLRRTRLSGDALELPRRRVIVLVLLTWLPLLVLSIVEGQRLGQRRGDDVPAGHRDAPAPADRRAPADPGGGRRSPEPAPDRRQFVDNGVIRDDARPQFDAAIASAMRLRNSVVVELLLVVFVYAVGMPLVWRDQLALDVNSWYATVAGGELHPSSAGRWLVYVSMPVLQFLTLRWYFRFFVWARFLWQVSRMRVEPGTDASRRHRRVAVPRAQRPCLPVRAAGARHDALRHDRQPDLS